MSREANPQRRMSLKSPDTNRGFFISLDPPELIQVSSYFPFRKFGKIPLIPSKPALSNNFSIPHFHQPMRRIRHLAAMGHHHNRRPMLLPNLAE